MQYDAILIRLGELFLKGRNRHLFVGRLFQTIKSKLTPFPEAALEIKHDHILVTLNGADGNEVMRRLDFVFGIHSYALGTRCESEMASICKTTLPLALELGRNGRKIKLETTRGWKKFPGTSISVSQQVAEYILRNAPPDAVTLSVKQPDETIHIMIKAGYTMLVSRIVPAGGGLPVGLNGRTLLMLSGGLDSPVAGYLMMKRGLDLEGIHFESPPYTTVRARQKVYDIAGKLAGYLPDETLRLHIIPFTRLQQEIFTHVPKSYGITIMRRMMYRIATGVAEKRKIRLLSNGESIGQVASQTPDSMHAINAVTAMPIVRPVACLDKSEVVSIAKAIDTFEISIRPYEDCCTVFVPRNPTTAPKQKKCEHCETLFEWAGLVQECIENAEFVEVRAGQPITLDSETSDEISSLL